MDNEKFGTFLTALRRERNMTQKELAERLFVSDKTVSKWERGGSMPNIALLLPIAEVFGITVTELLQGERRSGNPVDAVQQSEQEQAVSETGQREPAQVISGTGQGKKTLAVSEAGEGKQAQTTSAAEQSGQAQAVSEVSWTEKALFAERDAEGDRALCRMNGIIRKRRRAWRIACMISLVLAAVELMVLAGAENGAGLPVRGSQMRDLLLFEGILLLFAGWFCFFAKELLPSYYDGNKIDYVSQGIFRIHMTGLAFNNGNWPYLCVMFRIFALGMAVLYPLLCLGCLYLGGIGLWEQIRNGVLLTAFLALTAALYLVGRKYG
ncbi:MAG: helix-turn-helix transcriptional regulator [Eubacteriales bacterium]|nr:helix-turn-helix transcriptional regulator [Eubacteriales bacterium]